ncbi:pilus assembly protein [Acidovorax sp. sic0104]|uniref:pilus assembly protein n=1 Tax=Acidovorax sp. sic0104 TaxID=2854784 RepID=UPI001C45E202|nr:PilC/PilY family type IV pilus protein [Acidovorax sp. sic0104]MBV7539558.1 pilus assembly protein PilC [Acidovorax sp. sic0104]
MPCTPPRFRKSLLAMAASAALAPYGAWALDLAQEPPLPKVKPSFVAPNVIISVDDSGSMGFRLDSESQNGATNNTAPNADGTWPMTSRRMNVLRYSLKKVFNDKTLIPDNKIRLAWQAMHNNSNSLNNYSDSGYWYGSGANPGKGKTPGADNVGSTNTSRTNFMRSLTATHRNNFLAFTDYLLPSNGTPSHEMFKQSDEYLRNAALDKNSPWAAVPGTTDKPFLGCRRNYHIMMTDGRWNGTDFAVPDLNYRDNATNLPLPDGTVYGGTTAGLQQSALYRDESLNTDGNRPIADWAFYSWAKPLKTTGLTNDKVPLTQEYKDAPATESFTSGGKTVVLQKYWNPKYNPATWSHMVTYTIGFSALATSWKQNFTDAKYNITAPTDRVPFGYDGSFPALVTGGKTWPQMDNEDRRSLDLWHSALNGRGRFYAVAKGEDLENAFREIIGKINEDSSTLPDTVAVGSAGGGFNTTRSNAGNYASAYNGKESWRGWVSASAAREPVKKPCLEDATKECTYYPDPTKEWEGKTTADRLDELANLSDRLILSWSDEWSSTKFKGGVSFKWATGQTNLSTAQKALLGKETSDTTATVYTKGENVLNYIRGQRTLEGDKDTPGGYTAALPFRERFSRQGDIINSDIWFTGAPASDYSLAGYSAFIKAQKDRTPMLYVGGNDGMLHGFSALDGKEKIAYVPRGLIGDLKKLADPNYNHQYYVDGSPMTGDIQSGSTWSTVLVGTLGAGGKGYFALDVTDPSTFAESKSQQLALLDRTRGNSEGAPDCNRTGISTAEKAACLVIVDEDKDIGNITVQPVRDSSNQLRSTQVARLNNDRWAAVLGNGYNSENQRPVLLVQYLDGARELKRIQASDDAKGTGNANDNGLSAPTLVDLNGDGRADIVYAGDNLGNLWKFDLTSADATQWKSAFGIDSPLFTARGASVKNGARNQPQPITAPPIVRANDRAMKVASASQPVGGLMVAFGTGRNLSKDDRDVTKAQYKYVQTLYSVLDNARYRVRDTSKPKDEQRLEIHPGAGALPGVPAVPTPKAVGVMGGSAKLAKQEIVKIGATSNEKANAVDELKADTWKDFDGWYLDLPEEGERLLKPMQFWDGSNILAVYTEEPSGTSTDNTTTVEESCTPTTVATIPGVQYRTLINIMDGKNPTVQLVAGSVATGTTRVEVPPGPPLLVTSGKKILDYTGVNPKKVGDKPREDNRMPEQSLRPSWRQVQ